MITFIALFGFAAWFYLLFLHDNFWRANQRLKARIPELSAWPSVTAVVPARNEAEAIQAVVSALMAQDYPSAFSIVVIDDASMDGTGDLARAAASAQGVDTSGKGVKPCEIIAAPPLQAGWTGKLWALNAGLRHIAQRGDAPSYLWFTDADIVHPPQTLRRLVGKAVEDKRDLVSLMVRLRCETFWEKRLIPAFVFFFQMLYPFPASNKDRSKVAAGAGGCMLLRREAFEKAGGLNAVRGEIIDDCALAKLIKRSGSGIWIGLADESRSLRGAEGLGPLWRMVRRTAFTQLRHSNVFLFLTILGLGLVFLGPPLAVLSAPWHGERMAFVTGLAAWAAMAWAYRTTLLDYGRSPWEGWLLPAVALLYAAMTFDSGVAHWRQRGGQWKGRHYGPSAPGGNLPESP